jgi:hypothetical protein
MSSTTLKENKLNYLYRFGDPQKKGKHKTPTVFHHLCMRKILFLDHFHGILIING